MTERQERAIQNPCLFLADAGRIGLTETAQMGSGHIVTALTVDLFDSQACWHVGISLLNSKLAALPLAEWSHNSFSAAIDMGKALLDGVGSGSQSGGTAMKGIYQLHFKRPLTTEELSRAWKIADAKAQVLPTPAPKPLGAFYEVDTRAQ